LTQLVTITSIPTHVQPGEVWATVRITSHDLAIEHHCLGRQLVQQLRDGREALREIVAVAAVMRCTA